MNNSQKLLIDLIKISLNNEKSNNSYLCTDWEGITKLAVAHGMASCLYYAVSVSETNIDAASLKILKDYCMKAISKDTTQQKETELLYKEFNNSGIRYIPVKGTIIKSFYPVSDMRIMADADILTEKSDSKKIDSIMKRLGYYIEEETTDVTTYNKEPFVSIEIHRQLLEDLYDGSRYFSNKNVWGKMVSQIDNSCRYEMDINSFYLYTMYHASKHFKYKGTGIRTVADEWMILKKIGNDIDREFVDKGFEILDIQDFAANLEITARNWFGNEPKATSSTFENQILLSGGAFGRYENIVNKQINKRGRFGYIISRIFPSYLDMIVFYSKLKGRKYLLPLFWIYRILKSPFKDQKSLLTEIKLLFKR